MLFECIYNQIGWNHTAKVYNVQITYYTNYLHTKGSHQVIWY